ncbi:MAG: S8 family serine peptidase [Candidatus Tectomicrobia bacterium]|uniref:S8 family serine peptidase n=1 Tax=Tectimicrobiota bacterium TaxID=2528274 RepID=A0A932FXD4_UNCTE|nr:S8 family serine peptidase [Candidatus Tectomicrobia bacterium]
MDEIKLTIGGREVTFKKIKTQFGVRLKQGKASSVEALRAACGPVDKDEISHTQTVRNADMDLFAIPEDRLERTTDELRRCRTSDVVTHLYTLDDTLEGAVIPTGTLTLRFAPGVSKERKEQILRDHGLEIVEDLPELGNAHTVRLTSASTENPLKIAARLQQQPEVATAEPDLAFRAVLHYIPQDPLYRQQWHLRNRGDQAGLQSGADVKAEAAWDITRGSREIVVCVIDDGFDLDHPDFDASDKIVAPYDFGQEDQDPNPAASDDDHGTACAGVAVAEENGEGVVGLAPRCSLMPIRMSLWLDTESVRRMFQYAMNHGADVISCSWSAAAWDFPLPEKMAGAIRQAATQGRNGKGCVILFAAGNEDRPLNGMKDGQRSYQGFALHPDVIAVGASNSLDLRSSYSNHGPELALCAPSSGSPGRRIVTTDRQGAAGYDPSGYTSSFGGTSSATPLAAGLAALILSANPDLSSAEVKRIMMETADRIDPTSGQYDASGHSSWYGHGRINAARAVAQAAGRDGETGLPQALYMERRVGRPIPDQGEIQDVIPFPLEVSVQAIEVVLHITHSYRGDLRVTLLREGLPPIVLHDQTGGNADDLILTYRSASDPRLQSLVGISARGNWTLKVEDRARQDVGALQKWGIGITYRA